jgi:hypothetical protein
MTELKDGARGRAQSQITIDARCYTVAAADSHLRKKETTSGSCSLRLCWQRHSRRCDESATLNSNNWSEDRTRCDTAQATPAKPCHIAAMRTARCFASEVQEGQVDTRGRCDMQRFLAVSMDILPTGRILARHIRGKARDGILAAGSAVTLPLACHMMHWMNLMVGA